MRALLLIAAAGCGLREPTGTTQTWPPPHGVAIETVVASDLDGDGISELVAFATGTSAQAGLYLVAGDETLANGGAPQKFETYAQVPIATPTAGTAAAGLLYALYTTDQNKLELVTLDPKLAPKPAKPLELAPGGTVLWLAPVVHPAGLLAGNGAEVHYLSNNDDEQALASPLTPPIVLATGYSDAGVTTALFANATDVQAAPLTGSTLGTWVSARHGAPWVGQVAYDLDGDSYPEIVGYDPAQHAVCALALSFGTQTCVATGETSFASDVTIVIADVAGTSALDIAVVHTGAATADIALVQDIGFDGATLTGTGKGAVATALALPQAHAFALARGPARKGGVVVVSRAGDYDCAVCN
jgi:hypothetical protein